MLMRMNGNLKLLLPSPLHELKDDLFIEKKIKVFFKRDDLIHESISGNKWRKLKYNLEASEGRTIVTFGGAYSNHIAASAAACNYYKVNSIGIIRGERPKKMNNTLLLAEKMGMKLEFISRQEYKTKNSPAFLEKVKKKHENPFIIPEGGANQQGLRGCTEVIDELPSDFHYIVTAVGTGATIAGISMGLKKEQKAIGIVVLKGAEYLKDEIDDFIFNGSKENTDTKYVLNHDYHFGGYAKIDDELIQFMNDFYLKHQIKTDPVYSGKSLYALYDMIKKDMFPPHSKIIYYHCGGLQGIEGMEKRYGIELFPNTDN